MWEIFCDALCLDPNTLVDAELHDSGTPIGALDTLVAGIVREAGATLVTADDHFERVNGLDVHRYQ